MAKIKVTKSVGMITNQIRFESSRAGQVPAA